MERNKDIVLVAIVAIMAILIAALGIRLDTTTFQLKNIKREAVQLGYAYHEPTNGVWQWKPNLTEKK